MKKLYLAIINQNSSEKPCGCPPSCKCECVADGCACTCCS